MSSVDLALVRFGFHGCDFDLIGTVVPTAVSFNSGSVVNKED